MVLLPALLAIVSVLVLAPAGAGADPPTVTFSSTSTFPVPPASNYAGSGGGDGWALALTPKAVYNIFHHSGTMTVACHLQKDASECWSPKVVQDAKGGTFATSGHSGLWLDDATGKLYAFGVRNSDDTAGVACFDTVAADANQSAFCGFTPLGAPGDAYPSTASVTNIAVLGSKLYAFSFFGSTETGTRNKLLCFDTTTLAACAGQPYSLGIGDATDNDNSYPPPGVASIGGGVIVPMRLSTGQYIACFDGTGVCAGNWPIRLDPPGDVARPGSGYPEAAGAPFPHLTTTGKVDGFCLPYNSDPCWDMSGKPIATPDGMANIIGTTSGWNGPGVAIGPRVYVPNGNQNTVECYDYAVSAGCGQAFPRHFTNPYLSLLYTVNADPQRPSCLWVNADNGTQIQNFDAFTGGACGQGPIRVLTEKIVGSAPQCFPSKFTSLRIDSPARTDYTDGTVVFADASGNPAPGATPMALDANGAVDLSSLQLSTNQALPQFLITLRQGGDDLRPQAITVTVTWLGTFDQSCATGTTTIVNPPSDTPPPPPPTSTPTPTPTPNLSVKVTAPTLVRVGDTATYTVKVTNTSNTYASTGTELLAPVPVGASLVSVTPSQGFCPTGTTIHCFLQTIPPGGSATLIVVLRSTQPGTLTFTPRVVGDYDASAADNSAAASTPALAPGDTPPAPPAPTAPGTLNAIAVGTVLVNGVAVTPDTYFLLKTGDSVTLNGILVFTTINGSTGIFSNLPFTSAPGTSGTPVTFTVTAPNGPADITDLTLTAPDFSTCTAPRRLSAAPSSKVVRQLWGNAHGGFRTTAKYSSATIRGTIWGVVDRCDGTLTSDILDPVTVVDLVLNKTIELNPGQTYLAKPQAPFTPPAGGKNTVASVKKNGLIWQGQRFRTKKAFSAWLSQHQSSWRAWAQTHAALAAALASRRG